MYEIIVRLAIDADEFVRLYSGSINQVVARADDGRTVKFPANILRPFVTHDGINGTFKIYFDQQNKFSHIERI